MDVDAEEFLASLSVAQCAIIYIRKKTNNIHRSWILFHVRILNNDAIRLALYKIISMIGAQREVLIMEVLLTRWRSVQIIIK